MAVYDIATGVHVTRRNLLKWSALLGPVLKATEKSAPLLMVHGDQLDRMRSLLAREQSSPAAVLKDLAAAAQKAGPWSVTFHRPDHVQLEPNDYFSEGPYWWPDPANPDGPYIRRDGERNPKRFNNNHDDLGRMATTVLTLGMAASLFDDTRSIEHATKVLGVWFVDAKTRMNPDLEHGQAVRGINNGRGTGIIDTVSLIHCAQGVVLLEHSGKLDKSVSAGVRSWYAAYLDWLWTSKNGRDEQRSGNNHSTWYAAQSAAYAMFTSNTARQQEVWNLYRTFLVPHEIQPDGSCPREEARTKSLSYSAMNLDAFAVLCRLTQQTGVDLWHFHANNGVGVDKAFAYLSPFLLHPDEWKRQQIETFRPNSVIFPGLGAIGLQSEELMKVYKALPRAGSAWVLWNDWIVQSS
jgi:hypothetical protein